MRDKHGNEVTLDELTAENYDCPKGEERTFHTVIEVRQFDPKTGERKSRPRIQKFGRKMFLGTVRDALMKQGYEVRIIHDPREWEKAHAEQAAAERKAKAEAEARARQEQFDAAVAAAVAKALEAQNKGKKKSE